MGKRRALIFDLVRSRPLHALALAELLGCSRGETYAAEIGRDCGALQVAARAGAACDPALAVLAESLAQGPDEARCRAAVRTLLAAPAPEPAIRSAFAV